jgi:hypothetical protein
MQCCKVALRVFAHLVMCLQLNLLLQQQITEPPGALCTALLLHLEATQFIMHACRFFCTLLRTVQVGYETLNQMLGCTAAYPAKRIVRVGGPDDRCSTLRSSTCSAAAAGQAYAQPACIAL